MKITMPAVIALGALGAVAVVYFKRGAISETIATKLNPASNQNMIYTAANNAVQAATGEAGIAWWTPLADAVDSFTGVNAWINEPGPKPGAKTLTSGYEGGPFWPKPKPPVTAINWGWDETQLTP